MKNMPPCLLGGLLPNDGALDLVPLLIPSPLPAMLLSSAQVTKIVGQKEVPLPCPLATHTATPCFLRLQGPARVNNLVYKCIFCLHYATAKVLIYNLQHINHPSNFQMLHASLTFMFSSITWLFWGRGASQLLTKSISSGWLRDHKRQLRPPLLWWRGEIPAPCLHHRCLAHMQAGHKSN